VKKIIVAVDGPAGSGKSSVCRFVALDLGLAYIDSGALYRSITWYLLDTGQIDKGNYGSYLQNIAIEQEFLPSGSCRTTLNGQDLTESLRDERIARNIGAVSDNLSVREFVNQVLRKWTDKKSVIIDGRDIGTEVFPDADLRIYLDATVEVRASRRAAEYNELGKYVDEKTVQNQIILRDRQDRTRESGALKHTDNEIYIDTSNMSRDEVVRKIINLVSAIM
jgi:cytidylate kinase